MSPRNAYPPLSGPPRSSAQRKSYTGPSPAATPPPYHPNRSSTRSRSPSPSAHLRQSRQYPSSHRSSSSSSSPANRRISGNGTAAHPWNCADEFELLPGRAIQQQTGGVARGISSNGTMNTTAKTHTNHLDSTQMMAYNPSNKSQQQQQRRHTSSGTEDEYDKYGFSDCYPKMAANTIAAAAAPTSSGPAEDAYQRYLQQKEKASYNTIHTPRSASPSATTARSANRNSSPLLTVSSRSRSPSLERYYLAQEKVDHQPQQLPKSAATSAQELRARRLATQKSSVSSSSTSTTTDNLRLQSHNPAVQAYLARKEKERANPNNPLPPRRASPNSNSKPPSKGEEGLLLVEEKKHRMTMRHAQPQRAASTGRATGLTSSSSSSTGRGATGLSVSTTGRPPAFQPKSTSTTPNGTTTFTYQFQPDTSRAQPDADTPVKRTVQPDTSVTRARRLLQSKQATTAGAAAWESQDDPILSTRSERSHSTSSREKHTREKHSSRSARTTRSHSASGGKKEAAWNSQDPAVTVPPRTTTTTSILPRRTNSYGNKNKNASKTTSAKPTTTASADNSVTRARRLLQEGKGRDTTAAVAPRKSPTMGERKSPPMVAMASTPKTSSQGSSSTTNSSSSNAQRIPASGNDSSSNPQEQTSSTTSNMISTIPRPNPTLQAMPSYSNSHWSVRVCVISAVDFPVHVVPNMPLSPVLKLGLVSIDESSVTGKDRMLRDIDRKGMAAVSASTMRCTTTKLLSKRDNGAVEFHEELRWDHVPGGGPQNLALAVELCARGVLRPANLHESPPPHSVTMATTPRTVTPSPGRAKEQPPSDPPKDAVNNTAAAGAPTPIRPGGRLMDRLRRSANRNKGKVDSAMESAHAAAAVAKLLVQGSTSPMTPAKDQVATNPSAVPMPPPPGPPPPAAGSRGQSSPGAQAAPQEWDVTLRKAPPSARASSPTPSASSSDVLMTDDIRLGSLLIPLTELDELQRVLRDPRQPARLEKWFEVQNMNAAVMNMDSPSETSAVAAAAGRWLSRDRGGGDNPASGSSRSQSPTTLSSGGGRARRNPSILLELSLYAPDVLDESEDEMDEEEEEGAVEELDATVSKSFAKRTTLQVRNQLAMQSKNAAANAPQSPKKDRREEARQNAEARNQDPFLEPGIIDFITIVGARDIGDQKQDDGSKGWVQSTPECCVLEQFPPTEDFHIQHSANRSVLLPQKVEWFCFPDGVKLWRGTEPPAASDFLSQQQQQQSSSIMTPSQIMVSEAESTSLALFDAYLNCTTSFNWFVIASNSDNYGSATVKTYGAVIRFYVPAPRGIDPTQDDFAQTLMGGGEGHGDDDDELWLEQQRLEQEEEKSRGLFGSAARQKKEKKRLWVPIGICVTSSLPIVGIMEAVLMRSCEMMASRPKIVPSEKNKINNMIQRHLANLILNFQQPIAGAINCSVPFLLGESLQVRLPPKTGLPPLPHGNSVASVCRLLGPEGFIFVLAALLTESKIVLHSHNPANCAMVAEVMTALLYPFNWSLPYIPVLPVGMLEFIEAPLSYLLGIHTSCLEQNLVDPMVLEDVVVVDLDNGFSSPDWKTTTTKYKSPTPLPSLVASNISRAVYRLLRALENEHDFGEKHSHPVSNASDRLPRIQPESKAEREFRIAIALEMGGLVRGYQDCLVFVSTSQPVFNREKFLKRAPALFIEEPSGGSSAIGSRANKVKPNRRILSSRSKRFLSILVNCQHFHQFLEMLRSEECAFFHEVMEMWIKGDDIPNKSSDVSVFESSSSFDHTRAIAQLSKSLLALEEKITCYDIVQPHCSKPNGSRPEDDILQDEDYQILSREQRFPRNLLQQIDVGGSDAGGDQDSDVASLASKSSSQQKGVHHASLSVQYLVELEKNPWAYKTVLDISVPKFGVEPTQVTEVIAGDQSVLVKEKVLLRDTIGERKFRAWKMSKEQVGDEDHSTNSFEDAMMHPRDFGTKLDLASLMTSATEDTFSETSSQSSITNVSVGSRGGTNARSSLTPEQQRVANAKDRDVLRRCLEKAYAATPSQQGGQDLSEVFSHHGRDLVSEAEVALRNPSAQHFLLSLLSKRSKLDSKQAEVQSPQQRRTSRKQSNSNALSSSRLEPIAFECVVRLCCAMLDSCMETKDYEPAYLLLCHTAGLFTVQKTSCVENGEEEHEDDHTPMYMTARIGLHPLFADLGVWQKVMSLHLAEKNTSMEASDRNGGDRAPDSLSSLPSLSHSESFEDLPAGSGDDEKQYEAAVATLYEMLGYGIPAEELARFATKVSQECGWFSAGSERGQSLLLLARRLSMRRELADSGGIAPGEAGDLDIMQTKSNADNPTEDVGRNGTTSSAIDDDEDKFETVEIGWCHPAAPSLQGREPGGRATSFTSMFQRGGGQQSEYMDRSAVTALATFGPSVVVSGGLDGGVFLAHTAPRAEEEGADMSTLTHPHIAVRGIHLDWGSSGSRAMPGSSAASSDGEYGVGAVSCLAAATGAGGQPSQLSSTTDSTKDVLGLKDEEDLIREMGDSRVIAGTTCGDLRIWSVKDVYAAIHLAQNGDEASAGAGDTGRTTHAGSEASSSFIPSTPTRRRFGAAATDSTVGGNSNFNRLKFSLRGRALSGHRGGVTCVDVPSHVYRPDSVVTGGADGLIKLWSLRTSTIGRRGGDASSFMASSSTAAGQLRRLTTNRGGDALSVFSGHGGRVLCVKTAWHGDRLLSGGADRTIRIWDMMSSGKGAGANSSTGGDAACLHTLSGHFGWVTHVQYWGPNTIVSGSTDRSIALWDARVRNSPLFVLRHHHAPISDLLVGSRTDPLMVSAASDGTVTTWDFRSLSGTAQTECNAAASGGVDSTGEQQTSGSKHCKVVRHPTAVMSLRSSQAKFSLAKAGPTMLARGDRRSFKTVLSAGSDAVMREWDVSSGRLVNEWNSGHCDALTSITSLAEASPNNMFGVTADSEGASLVGGSITSSWDGTIRMRKRVPK